MFERNVRNMLL